MSKSTDVVIKLCGLLLITGIVFQNCSEGFGVIDGNSSSLASSSFVLFFTPSVASADNRTATNSTTPTLNIGGLPNDYKINLFIDPSCKNIVGSSVINANPMSVKVSKLLDGSYHFYLTYTTNSDLGNATSPCTDSNFFLTINSTVPNPPSSLSLSLPSLTNTSSISSIIVHVTDSDLIKGSIVTVYQQANCSLTSRAGLAISNGASSIDVPVNLSPAGNSATYTFYAQVQDLAGNISPCSSANTVYNYLSGPPPIDNSSPMALMISTPSALANDGTVALPKGIGSQVKLSVIYSAPIVVSGTPRIALNSGATAYANFSRSASNSIDFIYLVVSGENANPLDLATASIDLNGGTILSANKVAASLTLPPAGSAMSLGSISNIMIDTTPPPIPVSLMLIAPATSHSFITQPSIQISPTEKSSSIKLYSDSSCTSLVGSGLASGTSIVISTTPLSSASLPAQFSIFARATDLAGNSSSCSTALVNYMLDPPNPYVFAISNLSDPSSAGHPLGVGGTIRLAVQFSRPIAVSGAPEININASTKLVTGTALSVASSNDTLVFNYSVVSGDFGSPVTIASSAISLASGANISDVSMKFPARLNLPPPLITAMMTANSSYVDAVPPTITSLSTSNKLNTTPQFPIVTVVASKAIRTAQLFSDSNCATIAGTFSQVGSASNSVDVTSTTPVPLGKTPLFMKVTDYVGNVSVCSSGGGYSYIYSLVKLLASGPTANSTCALLSSGVVKCWGDNTYGQLGGGDISPHKDPVTVQGLMPASALAVGQNSACAIVTGGQVYCWGRNSNGQLGNASNKDSLIPVAVSGLKLAASQIALGENFACALLSDQTVKCWGANNFGQLGSSVNASSSNVAVDVGFKGATSVVTGADLVAALLTNGIDFSVNGAFCGADIYTADNQCTCDAPNASSKCSYGSNGLGSETFRNSETLSSLSFFGYQGIFSATGASSGDLVETQIVTMSKGNFNMPNSDFTLAPKGANATNTLSGGWHACALFPSGKLQCNGDNSYGQLGSGTASASDPTAVAMVSVSPLSSVISFALGRQHTCALSLGNIFCWGDNSLSQLGNASGILTSAPTGVSINTSKYSPSPVQVIGF